MQGIGKIFKAYDVRATYPNQINEDAAWKVGNATAQFLKKRAQALTGAEKVRQPNTIIVGRDMRPHSPSLAAALIEGIKAAGSDVIDIGMVDTSMVYFAINHEDCIGGIQTTASHNPINYNGFKISGPHAKPIGAASGLHDIRDIAGAISARTPAIGKAEQKDLWGPYRKHVTQFLNLKRKLRVAIDCANGMGGKMVPGVFGECSNIEIVPLLFEITGAFTHDPNPLVEKNLVMLQDLMARQTVDIGVAFDGDADRCIFLTEDGTPIGCDLITALLARDFLQLPANKGSAIVYDLRSSHVVRDEALAAGGVPVRDRVGHAFLKKTMAEKKAVFGGELSGHFYFRDNYFADSGAIAFARVLSVLAAQDKPFSQLIAPLRKYAQSGEVNFRVEDKKAKIKELMQAYGTGQVDHLDGITVEFPDWWFNVRESNTEPLLRLNLEANSKTLLDTKFAELKQILGEPAHGH